VDQGEEIQLAAGELSPVMSFQLGQDPRRAGVPYVPLWLGSWLTWPCSGLGGAEEEVYEMVWEEILSRIARQEQYQHKKYLSGRSN